MLFDISFRRSFSNLVLALFLNSMLVWINHYIYSFLLKSESSVFFVHFNISLKDRFNKFNEIRYLSWALWLAIKDFCLLKSDPVIWMCFFVKSDTWSILISFWLILNGRSSVLILRRHPFKWLGASLINRNPYLQVSKTRKDI